MKKRTLLWIPILGGLVASGQWISKRIMTIKHEFPVTVIGKKERIRITDNESKPQIGLVGSKVELDLTALEAMEEARDIRLETLAAHVVIRVPEGWYVKVKGRMAVAMVDNYTMVNEKEGPELYVHVNAIGTKIIIVNQF